MKAPDKIYLYKCKKQGIRTDGICTEWSEKPVILTEENIEYIRKGTLLEWLDGKLTIEGATEGYVGGYDSALKDVIDKLNEM